MIPIIFLYVIGIIFFVFGIEETEDKTRALIYLGIAFFSDYMGYFLSYQDADYLNAAYFPLVMGILTIVFMIYTGWNLIPHELSWEKQSENEDD